MHNDNYNYIAPASLFDLLTWDATMWVSNCLILNSDMMIFPCDVAKSTNFSMAETQMFVSFSEVEFITWPNNCKLKKLTLNEKSILKMCNSVIECGKKYQIYITGLKKKTRLGLFERCDSTEDIKKVIKS